MNNLPPEHAPLVQFPVQDNCLQIGGIALTRLAQRVGSTPFYAYDRQKITERICLATSKFARRNSVALRDEGQSYAGSGATFCGIS